MKPRNVKRAIRMLRTIPDDNFNIAAVTNLTCDGEFVKSFNNAYDYEKQLHNLSSSDKFPYNYCACTAGHIQLEFASSEKDKKKNTLEFATKFLGADQSEAKTFFYDLSIKNAKEAADRLETKLNYHLLGKSLLEGKK